MKKIFLTIAILTAFAQSHAAHKGRLRDHIRKTARLDGNNFITAPNTLAPKSAAEQLKEYREKQTEEHAKSATPEHPIQTPPDINDPNHFPSLGSK